MKKTAILLALLMGAMLAFAGCTGSTGGTTAAPTPTPAAAATATAAPATAQPEVTPAPPEPIEFELMVQAKFTDLRNSDNGDTSKGDQILEYIKEQTGVTLNLNIPAFGGYTDTLTLMFASGEDMPDAVQGLGITTEVFQQAQNGGLIVPITGYWDSAVNIQKYTTDKAKAAYTRDGDIWEIPIMRSNSRTAGIVMRWDWIQELGYTDITLDQQTLTLDEWSAICRDMTYNDPDGNGQADTWGFTQVGAWYKIPTHLLQAFGSNQGWQLDASGNLVDTNLTTNWDKTKQAIAYYRGMIEDGVIHPEALLMTSEEVRDKLYKGQVGGITAFGSCYSLAGFIENIQKIDSDGTLKWFNGLVGPAGESTYVVSGNDTGGWAVTADCADPGRLVSFFDWCLGDGYNTVTFGPEEGVDYMVDDDAEAYFTQEQYATYKQFNYFFSFTLFRRGENLNALKTTAYDLGLREVTVSDDFVDAYVQWADMWQFDVKEDLNYGYSPEISQAQYDASDALQQTIVKYLTGDGDESDLDQAVQDYMDAGYTQYMTDMDAWYKANIAK